MLPPGRLVDVGGFRLHVHALGEAGPTVVFDAALGGSSISWTFVHPPVGAFARAVAYESRGLRLERGRPDAAHGGPRRG